MSAYGQLLALLAFQCLSRHFDVCCLFCGGVIPSSINIFFFCWHVLNVPSLLFSVFDLWLCQHNALTDLRNVSGSDSCLEPTRFRALFLSFSQCFLLVCPQYSRNSPSRVAQMKRAHLFSGRIWLQTLLYGIICPNVSSFFFLFQPSQRYRHHGRIIGMCNLLSVKAGIRTSKCIDAMTLGILRWSCFPNPPSILILPRSVR